MCSRLQYKESTFKPGDRISVNSALKLNGSGKWTGFVRSDAEEKTKRFWVNQGFKSKLDVPATRFAERSRKAGEDVFDDVGEGKVVYAVGNRKTQEVRILTRAATAEEKGKYGHERVPVIDKKRFD